MSVALPRDSAPQTQITPRRKKITDRERIAQANARIRLDKALLAAEEKMLKVIEAETKDLVFIFMMDAKDLSPEKIAKVRALLQSFRRDREHCTSKVVAIKRRELAVLLTDEPQPGVQFFPRWSSK